MNLIKTVFFLTLTLYTQISLYAKDNYNLHFDFDTDTLNTLEFNRLAILKEELIAEGIDTLVLSGHTDNTGSLTYNYSLSQRRVEYIASLLDNDFVIIETTYHGETLPIAKGHSKESKAKNRRVEISWVGRPEKIILNKADLETLKTDTIQEATPKISEKEIFRIQSQADEHIRKLYAGLTPTKYQKTILNDEDNVIITEKGTVMLIRTGSFITMSGKEVDEVNLELKEYYTLSSFLSDNLTTRTFEGDLLETSGMLFLNAKDKNGEQLKLQQSVTIAIPKDDSKKRKKDMIQYNGIVTDSTVTWQANSEAPTYRKPFKINLKINKEEVILTTLDIAEKSNSHVGTVAKILKFGYSNTNGLKDLKKFKGKDLKMIKEAAKHQPKNIVQVKVSEMYVYNVTKLGYINSDRVIPMKKGEKRINVNVDTYYSDFGSQKFLLIYKNLNSFVAEDKDIKGRFSRIPKGSPIIILGIRSIAGQLYLAKKSLKATEEEVKLDFIPVSKEEFKKEVDALMKI